MITISFLYTDFQEFSGSDEKSVASGYAEKAKNAAACDGDDCKPLAVWGQNTQVAFPLRRACAPAQVKDTPLLTAGFFIRG